MIRKAYIHKYDYGQIEPEHKAVFSVLKDRGVDCQTIKLVQVKNGQLETGNGVLFVGDHDFIKAALKRSEISVVPRDSYPVALQDFLLRKVWTSTVRELSMQCGKAGFQPIFVKPASDVKLFTGFVLTGPEKLYRLAELPGNTEVQCAEVVDWKSEFRVFVNKSEIVGIRHYAGDPKLHPDLETIRGAVARLQVSDENTDGYGIDFGVLANGETALVEWNDGFALGAYGLDPVLYTDLLIARWEELTNGQPD